MSGWQTAKLGQFFRIKHGYAFKSDFFARKGAQIVLTPGNFRPDGGLKSQGEKEKFYSAEPPHEFVLKAGELLVVMTDLTQEARILGSPAFVPKDDRYLHNQRLGKIVELNHDALDQRYLYHLFNWSSVREQLKATATGATVKHTAPDRIYAVEVPLPALREQRRIASILSAYDDLIENNTRRIEILEEMARRIYEEWFVRFRAPGCEGARLVDSELGPIPEGWSVVRLGELANDVRDAIKPAAVAPDCPYVGLEHMPRRSTTLGEWGAARDVESLKLRFRAGDVLFGKIRPYFHKVVRAPVDGICSSDAIVLRARRPEVAPVILGATSSDAFVAHAVATSNGTKMPRADWKVLRNYTLMLPPPDLVQRAAGTLAPSAELAATLAAQNRNLREQRDLLLPKLISGEIDVSEAEMRMEAAE